MAYDEEKNASRIKLEVVTAKNEGYSGNDFLRLANILKSDLNLTEAELAKKAGIDPGYNNSGVGDLKRLLLSIWDMK